MIRGSCGSKSFEFSEGMETVGVDGSSCWPVPEASWLYSVVLRLLRTSVCWGWGMLKAPFTSKNLVSSFQLKDQRSSWISWMEAGTLLFAAYRCIWTTRGCP